MKLYSGHTSRFGFWSAFKTLHFCIHVSLNGFDLFLHSAKYTWLLYPWHLCGGVYSFLSFRLSIRLSFFLRWFVEFTSKFYIKVSQVGYISPTTHQKAFIFGSWVPWRVCIHTVLAPGFMPWVGLEVKIWDTFKSVYTAFSVC